MNLKGLLDCTIDVILARGLTEQDVDGESSTGDSEARGIIVEFRELVIVVSQSWAQARQSR